jgi:hypothetical protein
LVIYDQQLTSVDIINYALNQLNPHLSFTYTTETDNTIPYLDLTTHRHTHSLSMGIYRKPTQTDTTINFTSNHPIQHKLAAHYFYIHRMLSLPISNHARHSKWEVFKTIAQNNAFPIHLLYSRRNKLL